MKIIAQLLTLAVAIGLLVGIPRAAQSAPKIGQPAPALTGKQLDSQPFDLSTERGKVVIVHYWATWCPQCRLEMPALQRAYQQYHDQGLDIIGVNEDQSRDRKSVRKAMQAFTFPCMMAVDVKSSGFGANGTIPDTYVIDSTGIVRAMFVNAVPQLTDKLVADAVVPLLPAKPTSN
jgi:peroxiredoxin